MDRNKMFSPGKVVSAPVTMTGGSREHNPGKDS